jgi:hypothetical protein
MTMTDHYKKSIDGEKDGQVTIDDSVKPFKIGK